MHAPRPAHAGVGWLAHLPHLRSSAQDHFSQWFVTYMIRRHICVTSAKHLRDICGGLGHG
jgi:hypothetical protein